MSRSNIIELNPIWPAWVVSWLSRSLPPSQNLLTAVTPRHPGRAGLSNCAKILPKKGEIVPKKGESRHRPFVRILLTDMYQFPKRHLVNVPPTFAKANQF